MGTGQPWLLLVGAVQGPRPEHIEGSSAFIFFIFSQSAEIAQSSLQQFVSMVLLVILRACALIAEG